jgi:glycosyltransferase involved in cell wall biosynthesis
MPPPPTLSIVVPCHDEADGLPRLLSRLREVLGEARLEYEVWLVDDGSVDATWERIAAAAGQDPRVGGVRLSRRFGKEAAIAAGLERARGDAVVVCDADLQHPPETIPLLVERWRRGFAVVDGVKRGGAGASGPGVATRAFLWLLFALGGPSLAKQSDFKLLDRRAVDAWRTLPERRTVFRGLTEWLGFEHAQVEYEVAERSSGRRRFRLRQRVGLALDAVTSFTAAPLRLVTLLGAGFFLFASALGAQTLFNWATGRALSGFTTVILLLLLSSSGILVGLGIVGEYLARIYDELKQRPRYVARDTIAPSAGSRPVVE